MRLAVICALTTWVTQVYGLPEAALAAYVVFFLNRADRTSSVLICIAFTILVSLIIGLLVLLANGTLDHPPLRVAVMAGLSFTLLFLGSASKLKPVAGTISLVLAFALDVLGKLPVGELATRALLYAWLLVGVPAGISVLVNLLAGPAPWRMATSALALRLRACEALLVAPDEDSRAHIEQLIDEGNASILGLLKLAALEKSRPASDMQALQHCANSVAQLLFIVIQAASADVSAEWRAAAASTLGEMAQIFERDLYPTEIEALPVPARASHAACQIAGDFNAILTTFSSAPGVGTGEEEAEHAHSGFLASDAWSNPDHVRFALKATAAAMFCYLFYSLADWPGIHTCLITVYIVALPTAAETVEKMLLRIAGALLGAALGIAAIVWVLPALDSIYGLLLLVFAGALLGGWIAAGSPRIGYAGFQITFAFFLCIIQGSGPAFDLVVARDRVIGILIGIGVTYIIFVHVWPVSIAPRINTSLATALRRLAALARLPERAGRLAQLPAAHAGLAAVNADLEIAGYEPLYLRPDAQWFETRHEMMVNARDEELRLLSSDDHGALARAARHLDRMAQSLESNNEAAATCGHALGEEDGH